MAGTDYGRLAARRELTRIQAQREREHEADVCHKSPEALGLRTTCVRCGNRLGGGASHDSNTTRMCFKCQRDVELGTTTEGQS